MSFVDGRGAVIDDFQPWMALMTDGAARDLFDGAVRRVVETVESKRLAVFPIGICGIRTRRFWSDFTAPHFKQCDANPAHRAAVCPVRPLYLAAARASRR